MIECQQKACFIPVSSSDILFGHKKAVAPVDHLSTFATALYHSFTLPAEILLIMYFEQKQNTIRIGTTEIATPR